MIDEQADRERLETQTGYGRFFTRGTSMVAAVALAAVTYADIDPDYPDEELPTPVHQDLTDASASGPTEIRENADANVAAELRRIHNELINEQVEFDDAAQEAIYSNLWEMYE